MGHECGGGDGGGGGGVVVLLKVVVVVVVVRVVMVAAVDAVTVVVWVLLCVCGCVNDSVWVRQDSWRTFGHVYAPRHSIPAEWGGNASLDSTKVIHRPLLGGHLPDFSTGACQECTSTMPCASDRIQSISSERSVTNLHNIDFGFGALGGDTCTVCSPS